MIPTTEHLALWNEKGCRDGMECMTGILDNGGGEAMILEGDMPRHFIIGGTGHLASAVTLFAFCPICGRSLKPNAPRSAGSAEVDLLRDLAQCYEEDAGIKLDNCDQDTTQYAVWEFLTRQLPNAAGQGREAYPAPACSTIGGSR